MTKLRLKRTPAEEQERARRKAYKAAKKAAKRRRSGDENDSDPAPGSSSRKQHRTSLGAAFSDDDVYGPSPPPTSSYKPDYDAIRAELEYMRFRDKMCSALEDDERLDGVNARFNDYAHVPDRWARDKHDSVDPQYMDDDEYAEWVREGMWKKKHAREYEEQVRRDAEMAAQSAREKKIKAETAGLEKLALEQEERRRKERQRQRDEEYRQRYEQRWKVLLDPRNNGPLTFGDIPWPLFSAHIARRHVSDGDPPHLEEITPEAITTFLLPDVDGVATPATNDDIDIPRRNRDKLKETLLRFHPDKFEGRFMHRVPASDIESVTEAVGQVARVLNVLMSAQS
ncbi:hypothetical protein J3R82DRAFT_1453 [Butyriboletus roseoflavus]|nr:hypothetical protein J3R82DRAFT_1453 [Butyriboletus roseoflavus]